MGSLIRCFNLFNRSCTPNRIGHAATSLAMNIRVIATSFKDQNKETDKQSGEKFKVIFERPDGEQLIGEGKEGENLLDVVVNCNLDIDGYGACEGTLSCSTCHLILSEKDYEAINPKPTDEELDMLDLAYGLTDTSRLGCQIILKKELDNLKVKIPEGINDVRSD